MIRMIKYSVWMGIMIALGIVGMVMYLNKYPEKRGQEVVKSIKPMRSPKPSVAPYAFDLPPLQAQYARIISQSGENQWESRIATVASALKIDRVTQGETIITGNEGKLDWEIGGAVIATMSANTQIDFVETVFPQIVLAQTAGRVDYTSVGVASINVRNRHLLMQINSGQVTVIIDPTKPVVTLVIDKGSCTLGFNNLSNVTKTNKIEAGNIATYNEVTRKLSVKKIMGK